MMERFFRGGLGDRICEERRAETERCELSAFFRELGLGWEVDGEGLIDRLADPRRAW